MFLEATQRLGGKIQLCRHLDGKDVPVSEAPFNNLLLNVFIDALNSGAFTPVSFSATNAGIGSGTRVGTGTAAPSETDTALQNPVLVSDGGLADVVSGITYDSGTDEYVVTRTARTQYAPAATSYNLSEVGIYSSTNATPTAGYPMISRSLIKDAQGQPTTFTLEENEVLVIYYTFTCRFKRTITASVTIKSAPVDLEFVLHFSSTAQIQNFPFTKGYCFGAFGTHLMARSTSFTMPAAFTTLSTSGWTGYNNVVTPKTPQSASVGFKQRDQVGLTAAVMNPLIGLSFSTQSSNHNRTCLLKLTPGIDKTSLDVINFETLNVFSRL